LESSRSPPILQAGGAPETPSIPLSFASDPLSSLLLRTSSLSSPRVATLLLLLLCLVGLELPALFALQGGSGRITLGGPALERLDVQGLSALAEDSLQRMERRLDVQLHRSIELFVVNEEERLDPEIRPHFAKWTVALANTRTGRIDVLAPRVRSEPPGDLGTVLRHEFVHVLLGQLEVELSGGAKHLPVWMHEGLAQMLAGQGWFPNYDEALLFRARAGTLLSFGSLAAAFPREETHSAIAYAQSLSFLQYCEWRVGLDAVLQAARDWLRGDYESLDQALVRRESVSFGSLAADWREDLKGPRRLLEQLSRNCFQVLVWLCVPLLLLVVWRRMRRARRLGERLERIERLEDAAARVQREELAVMPISRAENAGRRGAAFERDPEGAGDAVEEDFDEELEDEGPQPWDPREGPPWADEDDEDDEADEDDWDQAEDEGWPRRTR
jgi:hypothetical protein